jgi:hypothetical protein
VIDPLPSREFNHVTTRFATVNQFVTILDATRMIGVNHCDFDVAYSLGAAFVHLSDLFRAFLTEPTSQLRYSDDKRIVLFTDLNRVSDVIAMTMGAKNNIDFLDVLFGHGAHRIAHNPWIDDDRLPAWSFDAECCVTQPRKLNAF